MMAERIEQFSPPRGYCGGQTKYPWDDWADGSVWLAKRGTDFDCTPGSFKKSARSWANSHGYRIKVAFRAEDTVEFQFTRKDTP